MPPALLPFWLIRVVWCPLAGPVVALCVPRPCVMKMFHAPVERSTVDPSRPVPRSKTAPVKIKKRSRNSPEKSSFEPDRGNTFYRRQPRQLMRWRERFHQAEMVLRCFRWSRSRAACLSWPSRRDARFSAQNTGSGTPPGCDFSTCLNRGIASLDPRLPSGILPGCLWPTSPPRTYSTENSEEPLPSIG